MNQARRRFRNRYEGFNQAFRSWICRACGLRHDEQKPKTCAAPDCDAREFWYFASRIEADHFASLALLERTKQIRDLRGQPRYDLKVNGVKIATYVADMDYRDLAGVLHVVDVKPKGRDSNLEKTSVLKMRLFQALYCNGDHTILDVVRK